MTRGRESISSWFRTFFLFKGWFVLRGLYIKVRGEKQQDDLKMQCSEVMDGSRSVCVWVCVCVAHLLVDDLQSVLAEVRAQPFRGPG